MISGGRAAVAALAAALLAVGAGVGAVPLLTAAAGGVVLVPTGTAVETIPAGMLALYRQAARTCPGLPWPVLAGIGRVESDHGRVVAVSSAGAEGPMQFLPSSWARHGVDADGDGDADVWDPVDAVHGAARYLCAAGGATPARLREAIFAYNHADWYVDLVLAHADRYARLLPRRSAGPAALAGVLQDPALDLSEPARADLMAGLVDARVVALLSRLAAAHRIGVGVLRTGHSVYVAGSDPPVVSLHFCGQAVDLGVVDGQPVSARSAAARRLVVALSRWEGPLAPDEIGQPFPDLVGEGVFTDARHRGHIHVGYGPRCRAGLPGQDAAGGEAAPPPTAPVASARSADG